jgi:MFS family permease
VGAPFGLVGALTGVPAGWVCRSCSPRAALLTASLAATAGLVVMLAARQGGAAPAVTAAVLQGVALGFFYTAANNLLSEAVPSHQQGIGASLLYTVLGVANGIGSAAVSTITARHTQLAADGGRRARSGHRRAPATGGTAADLEAGVARRSGADAPREQAV